MKVMYVIPGSKNPAAFSFSKEQVACAQNMGIETYSFYLESRMDPFMLRKEFSRFKKELAAFNPDIVHAHYGTVNGYFASCGHKKPFVITYHGSDLNPSPVGFFREKIGKYLSKKTAKKAHHIICVSDKLKQRIAEFSTKIDVIPMGADAIFFMPLDKNLCRSELGLDSSKKYILFNGSDPIIKRTELAQASVRELQKKYPNAELIILSGKSKTEIKQYMNACDTLLVCSLSEGSPVIVKEAMACNLPIVSTDVGDIKEVTKGCQPNLICEDQPQEVAKALANIIQQNSRSNGRLILQQKGLTITESVKKLDNIYNTLLANA